MSIFELRFEFAMYVLLHILAIMMVICAAMGNWFFVGAVLPNPTDGAKMFLSQLVVEMMGV